MTVYIVGASSGLCQTPLIRRTFSRRGGSNKKIELKRRRGAGGRRGGSRRQGKKEKDVKANGHAEERRDMNNFTGANLRFSLLLFSLSLSSQRADLGSREVSLTNATSPSSYDDIKKYVHLNKTSMHFAKSKFMESYLGIRAIVSSSVSCSRILVHRHFLFFFPIERRHFPTTDQVEIF